MSCLRALILIGVTVAGAANAQTTDGITAPTGADNLPKSTATFWNRESLTGEWGGIRTRLLDKGLTIVLQDQSEVWGNLTGGLRSGVTYDGLTSIALNLDVEKILMWQGASVSVSAFQIRGRGPSSKLVGNFQLVSNIEATHDIKLYALWLEQKLMEGRLSIRVGQEGANDEMMISRYGGVFINSSFGFPGLPAADLPSGGPNYPMATPFVRVRFDASDNLSVMGAVFNGDPAPEGSGDPQLRDRGGVAFRLGGSALSFLEFRYSRTRASDAESLASSFTLGAWYSSSRFQDQLNDASGLSLANPASTHIGKIHHGMVALYAIADQVLWKQPGSDKRGIGAFLHVMGAPGAFSVSHLFVEAGLNWLGPFAARENDIAAFGIAYLGISPALQQLGRDLIRFGNIGGPYRSNETAIEATYSFKVSPWWSVQPNVQVLLNPLAGLPNERGSNALRNSVIVGTRSVLTF